MSDSIDLSTYLREQGYAAHVIRGGLEGLVAGWESTVLGPEQSSSAYIMYYEFLNDVDGRRILRECVERISPDQIAPYAARIDATDRHFRRLTIAIPRCVWGEIAATKNGYDPTTDWYYYRRPITTDDSWSEELTQTTT